MTHADIRLLVPASLAGRRLDHVLDALVEGQSRAQLQKLVRRGRVRVNGKRVTRSNVNVNGSAEITLEADGSREAGGEPTAAAARLRVLHEDAHILVIEKPTGMLTHPASRSRAPSVSEELNRRYGPLPTPFGEERPGIVHRLDRETSGLLVVGREERAMRHLQSQFRAQRVEKTYLALVSNVPPTEPFRIEEPLGPVPNKLDRQMVSPPSGAKAAATAVECVQTFARHALVACRPKTGRRHQIRVHLAFRGLPVLGDPLYGTRNHEPLPDGVSPPGRLALHAHELSFRHPESGQLVTFESELPEDLEWAVRQLGSSTLHDGPR
jgi:23S rRNA pseudouridine1911/1915/1917 synthase